MTDMALDYVVPSPALAPYVTLFYLFRYDLPGFDQIERADHAQLRFQMTPSPAFYQFADGKQVGAAQNHFVGPTSGAVRTCVDGPIRTFGLGLTPAGWEVLTGIDAHTALNRVFDAADRLGLAAADIAAAFATCTTAEEMAAIAEARLGAMIGVGHPATLRFVRAVDAWLCDADSPEIDDLVDATGLSRRQVERRCNALYGAPPKLLARKYRALRAAVALADGAEPPDAFYDQSHMIREIKQFTGLTPRKMRDPGMLAKLTIAQRRALEGQVSPIISDT